MIEPFMQINDFRRILLSSDHFTFFIQKLVDNAFFKMCQESALLADDSGRRECKISLWINSDLIAGLTIQIKLKDGKPNVASLN